MLRITLPYVPIRQLKTYRRHLIHTISTLGPRSQIELSDTTRHHHIRSLVRLKLNQLYTLTDAYGWLQLSKSKIDKSAEDERGCIQNLTADTTYDY